MLYDTKWDAKIKADPFSMQTLIAWLEMQPADDKYDYNCNGHCLLSQYFTAQGFKKVRMGSCTFIHSESDDSIDLPEHFNLVAQGRHIKGIPPQRTIGGALERARKVLASR